jgi:membrane associated rhomboid family serine protease
VQPVIPLKDENPTSTTAVVTILIIAACVGIYFLIQPAGQGSLLQGPTEQAEEELVFSLKHAAIPCEVTKGRPLSEGEVVRTFRGGDTEACESVPASQPFDQNKPVYFAVFYSMFLHGGLLHLAGNMLFLWVFGNNIEERMGHINYALFYVIGGLAATIAHIAVQPESTVPVVGASGAIAAVMGAYLVVFPDAPIRTLVIFYLIFFQSISAKWLLGFWFISQFFINPNSGVAWMAHVGGFVFGVVVALIFRPRLRPPRHPTYPAYPY